MPMQLDDSSKRIMFLIVMLVGTIWAGRTILNHVVSNLEYVMVFKYQNHIVCTCILIVAFLPFSSHAQIRNAEFEIHKRGNLWETVRDNGLLGAPDPNNRFQNFPSLDWPGGPTVMNKDDQRHYRVSAGL